MRRKIFWLLAFFLLVFIVCGYDCINAAEKSSPKEKRETAGTGTKAVKKSKGFASKQEALNDFLDADGDSYLQYFMTPIGELKLVNKQGTYKEPTEVRLNGEIILKAQKNADGMMQEFGVNLFLFPFQRSADHVPGKEPRKIDRVLLEEGTSLDRITQFILLDFTCGDKPFVSERFGFNPDLEGYVYLEKVKWGKEKSYIYMHVNQRAVYYTCDRVEMDWDYYMRKEEEDKKNKKNPRQIKPDKTPFRRP